MSTDHILRSLMIDIEKQRAALAELQDKISSAISDPEIREDAWKSVYFVDIGELP